jgi:hypothetical protein
MSYNARVYITNDVAYGQLLDVVGGNTVTPTAFAFEKDDVVKIKWNPGYATVLRSWFVFHADNSQFHRLGQLPMYFMSGSDCTREIEISMTYDHDVIIVAETT